MTNASGETIDRWLNYETAAGFAELVAAGVADPTPVDARERNYAAHPTARDAAGLGRVRASRGEFVEAVTCYRAAQRLNSDPAVDYLYEIFESKASGFRRKLFTADEVRASADSALARPHRTPLQSIGLAAAMTSIARRNGTPEMAAPFLDAAVRSTGGAVDTLLLDGRREILPDHALIVLKDSGKAIEYFRRTLPAGWAENAEALNDFAWWCCSNRLNLDEAERMARKGLELAKPGPDRASLLDTAAEIALARGDRRQAVTLAEQAVREHPERGYYRRQLDRFKKELEASGDPRSDSK